MEKEVAGRVAGYFFRSEEEVRKGKRRTGATARPPIQLSSPP